MNTLQRLHMRTDIVRSQEHEFTNTCRFQAHKLLKSFIVRRVEEGRDVEKNSPYLFIKQWGDRIYVNTLNDYLNISCQMSIALVVQLIPVDSLL